MLRLQPHKQPRLAQAQPLQLPAPPVSPEPEKTGVRRSSHQKRYAPIEKVKLISGDRSGASRAGEAPLKEVNQQTCHGHSRCCPIAPHVPVRPHFRALASSRQTAGASMIFPLHSVRNLQQQQQLLERPPRRRSTCRAA